MMESLGTSEVVLETDRASAGASLRQPGEGGVRAAAGETRQASATRAVKTVRYSGRPLPEVASHPMLVVGAEIVQDDK